MNEQERQDLIEKRENGTLTAEEYAQYLDLLENDPGFADQLALHQLLVDDARTRADEQLWEAVEALPISEEPIQQRPFVLLVFLRQNARYLAAAAIVLALGVTAWLLKESIWPEVGQQLVKTEKRDVRLLADSTRLGYDDSAGSVWVQYRRNSRQATVQAYTFCQDTLTVFLKNSRDTAQFQTMELFFNAKQQILYIKMPNQLLLPLRECSDQPLPFLQSP